MNIHNWLKQTKKELIYLLILIILLVIFAKALHKADSEEQVETTNSNEIVVSSKQVHKEYLYNNMDKNTVKIASIGETVTAESADDIDAVEFPYYDSIPLSEEVQKYIYETAEEYSISYTLVLAIAKVESNYDPTAIGQGRDMGLYQINSSNTLDWVVDMADIEDFEWDNPKHNARAAINYLSWLREYWLNKGYSEEDTFNLVVTSYNWGYGAVTRHIEKHGYVESVYAEKVFNAKIELEVEGGEF
jgi:hypothetical protein